MKTKKIAYSIFVAVIWLILWQVAASIIQNPILFAGPQEVLIRMIQMFVNDEVYRAILYSFLNIGMGFLIAFISGVVVGFWSGKNHAVQTFLAPMMGTMKAVPMASFAILLLIWFGAKSLSMLTVVLIVFPQIYLAVIEGMKQVKKEWIELARVYEVSEWEKIRYLYLKEIIPYLVSTSKVSIGMGFKSGVAAEVIGLVKDSFGEGLYFNRIYLDTAGVFAWTILIILSSQCFETVFLLLLKGFEKELVLKYRPFVASMSGYGNRQRKRRPQDEEERQNGVINLKNVSFGYHGKSIIENLNTTIYYGDRKLLEQPSGTGKTTLFRLLANLEQPTSGEICEPKDLVISYLFQDERLLEHMSAIDNIRFALGLSEEEARNELMELLDSESIEQPVCELSGGMKQRVEVVRACTKNADLYLLDEPLKGLDSKNRKLVAEYILKKIKSKTMIVALHHKEEQVFLNLSCEVENGEKDRISWDYHLGK